MNARLLKAKFRATRQSKWARNTKHAKLFHYGTIPSALFGMECVPIPPTQIKRLRAEGLRSHCLHSPGIAHDTAWMALAPAKDPAFLVALGPVASWHREVWLNSSPIASNMHGDIVVSGKLCAIWEAYKTTPTKHHGRMAKKTITALITGLRSLNWTLNRWDSLTLHDGREVSLSICPPAMLRHLAIQAYTQTLVTKFESKLKSHHPDHYDLAKVTRRLAIDHQATRHHEQVPARAIQLTLSKLGSANTLKARTMLHLISGSVLTRT
jgi:hypothetical protein